ncbi:unnamed protein product [Ceutorhynchus assimilis]|uniref:C2H2-type domain-containing protein n=1 Tax=Ceutorhynchus assimilis TaxID=467358 RepID=A0A9N9QK77_9CUCU|nr:unnamed protein product [Ceutorhynchus assimilis]
MGPNETICRICLQIIEEEEPYCVLRSNDVLLEDLELISPVTFNNLHLTEEPSICDLCEITIRELATFQKSIVSIEEELQKNPLNNAETTCRLCLQKFDSLTTSWKDCEGLLLQCNLLMLLNIEAPKNVCQGCVGTLENLNDFLLRASKNESVIVARASKTGLLTSEDLFSLSSMNVNHVEESLHVTITKKPNTYQKKKLKSNNMPSTSKELYQETQQMGQKFTKIDASPARITDFTFGEHMEYDPNNEIQNLDLVEYEIDDTDTPSDNLESTLIRDNNSAQELVDILEGQAEQENYVVTNRSTRKRKVTTEASKIKKIAKEEKEVSKPIEVTIIKRTKNIKKTESDKTWHELVGTSNKDDTSVVESKQGADIKILSPKRGRPKVPVVNNSSTVWFYCDLCSFKTYSQNSLVAHQLIHTLRGPDAPNFHCDLCNFETPSAEMMRAHKSKHPVANVTYKCIFCDNMFKRKVTCMYHTLKHNDQDIASQFYCMVYNGSTEEELFECYQCFYQDSEESAMPDHVIGHNVETVKTCLVTTYKCDQCLYITKDQELLERHKTMHEDGTKRGKKIIEKEEPKEEVIYKCDKCPYMSKNKRSLSNHKGLKHNRSMPPPKASSWVKKEKDRPLYYCNECSYSTPRKVNLPRHQLVHRTKQNMEFLECSHCIFETKHRRSYTRHLESVHGLIS